MDNMLENTINILREAGEEVLKIYNKKYAIRNKEDKSQVTEADLISNKIIVDYLRKYGWQILSEELNNDINIKSKKFWILDPLDGTMDFIQKTGEFSIMLGLVEFGRPIMGFVYQPCSNKMYYAEYKKGAYLMENGVTKKLNVSDKKTLSDCKIIFSRNHLGDKDMQIAKNMGIKEIVQSGSNGIKIGLIAEGKADIFFNLSDKMGKWDSCAPQIIISEAGGKMSDTSGGEIRYDDGEIKNKHGILASNKIVHNKIIKYLKND